ncbi:hypothetical protein MesoLj113c_15690 [Mesorhizobium sp. 113-3-9]|nr:hypothetical protein MesoLj113c_15690 [Mesorhizobium sp. 113-3-9]
MAGRDWVEEVVSKGCNIYLRPRVLAMSNWTEALLGSLQVPVDQPARVAALSDDEGDSLEAARRCFAKRAAAAQLIWRSRQTPDEATDAPLAVGDIEVTGGRLRSKFGGIVARSELAADLNEKLRGNVRWLPELSLVLTPETALSFLLMRSRRGSHCQVGGERDGVELSHLLNVLPFVLLQAFDHSDCYEAISRPRKDGLTDETLLELEVLSSTFDRAAAELEPAFALGGVVNFCNRHSTLARRVGVNDRLLPIIVRAVVVGLLLGGVAFAANAGTFIAVPPKRQEA